MPTAEFLAVLRDPLTGFDRFAVVRAGLMGWSYDAPITVDGKTPGAAPVVPGTPKPYDPIDDLSDPMVEFIATEIMRRTKPALFQTEEERAAERKNDSSGSIAT